MRYILTIATLLTACGSDPYTWGDVTQRVSEADCEALIECGILPESELDTCIAELASRACETADCDAEVDEDEGTAAVAVCVAALAGTDDVTCEALGEGELPPACDGVRELEPR